MKKVQLESMLPVVRINHTHKVALAVVDAAYVGLLEPSINKRVLAYINMPYTVDASVELSMIERVLYNPNHYRSTRHIGRMLKVIEIAGGYVDHCLKAGLAPKGLVYKHIENSNTINIMTGVGNEAALLSGLGTENKGGIVISSEDYYYEEIHASLSLVDDVREIIEGGDLYVELENSYVYNGTQVDISYENNKDGIARLNLARAVASFVINKLNLKNLPISIEIGFVKNLVKTRNWYGYAEEDGWGKNGICYNVAIDSNIDFAKTTSTLIHELKHVHQFVNKFKMDSMDLPWQERAQEKDAVGFEKAMMAKHYKDIRNEYLKLKK